MEKDTRRELLLRHKPQHAIAAARLQGGGKAVEHGIHQALHSIAYVMTLLAPVQGCQPWTGAK